MRVKLGLAFIGIAVFGSAMAALILWQVVPWLWTPPIESAWIGRPLVLVLIVLLSFTSAVVHALLCVGLAAFVPAARRPVASACTVLATGVLMSLAYQAIVGAEEWTAVVARAIVPCAAYVVVLLVWAGIRSRV